MQNALDITSAPRTLHTLKQNIELMTPISSLMRETTQDDGQIKSNQELEELTKTFMMTAYDIDGYNHIEHTDCKCDKCVSIKKTTNGHILSLDKAVGNISAQHKTSLQSTPRGNSRKLLNISPKTNSKHMFN